MRGIVLFLALCAGPALADTVVSRDVVEWKSVYATVEARNEVPARARIGGTVAELLVTESDRVAAGAMIGRVVDDKLDFLLAGLDAQISAAEAQLANARTELARGEALVAKGLSTAQRLDALRTQVDVIDGQLLSLGAERSRVIQTQAEGAILAPAEGVVLNVPVTSGEVIMAGESTAIVGTGGLFLRLQVPERHAASLKAGDEIRIGENDDEKIGLLSKIYPRIAAGRVQADIEVGGLDTRFVGERVVVQLPVGHRFALTVPQAALIHRGALDFVTVQDGDSLVERVVLAGEAFSDEGGKVVEILSGLAEGEKVIVP